MHINLISVGWRSSLENIKIYAYQIHIKKHVLCRFYVSLLLAAYLSTKTAFFLELKNNSPDVCTLSLSLGREKLEN